MKIVANTIQQARKFEAYLREMGVQHTVQARGTWAEGKELVFALGCSLPVTRIPSDQYIVVVADGVEISVKQCEFDSTVEFVCKEQ